MPVVNLLAYLLFNGIKVGDGVSIAFLQSYRINELIIFTYMCYVGSVVFRKSYGFSQNLGISRSDYFVSLVIYYIILVVALSLINCVNYAAFSLLGSSNSLYGLWMNLQSSILALLSYTAVIQLISTSMLCSVKRTLIGIVGLMCLLIGISYTPLKNVIGRIVSNSLFIFNYDLASTFMKLVLTTICFGATWLLITKATLRPRY